MGCCHRMCSGKCNVCPLDLSYLGVDKRTNAENCGAWDDLEEVGVLHAWFGAEQNGTFCYAILENIRLL